MGPLLCPLHQNPLSHCQTLLQWHQSTCQLRPPSVVWILVTLSVHCTLPMCTSWTSYFNRYLMRCFHQGDRRWWWSLDEKSGHRWRFRCVSSLISSHSFLCMLWLRYPTFYSTFHNSWPATFHPVWANSPTSWWWWWSWGLVHQSPADQLCLTGTTHSGFGTFFLCTFQTGKQ